MGRITVDLGVMRQRGLEVEDFMVRGKSRLVDVCRWGRIGGGCEDEGSKDGRRCIVDENISQPAIGYVKCAYHFRLPSDLMSERLPVVFACPPSSTTNDYSTTSEKEGGIRDDEESTTTTSGKSGLSTPISIRTLLNGFVLSVNEQRKRWMQQKSERWGRFVEWGDNGGVTTVRLEFFPWPDFFGEQVLSIRALFWKFEDWE